MTTISQSVKERQLLNAAQDAIERLGTDRAVVEAEILRIFPDGTTAKERRAAASRAIESYNTLKQWESEGDAILSERGE